MATADESLTLVTSTGELLPDGKFADRRIVWARRLTCDSPRTPAPAHPEQVGCAFPQ
jgi:hypothetical protein